MLLTIGLIGSATAGVTAATSDESPPRRTAPADDRVRDIRRGVLIQLESGARLRILTSPNYRRTTVEHSAPGAGWGPKHRLVRKKRLYCGDVKAATSGQGVALTVLCDRHGYAEDQAPVRSQAMVSTDSGHTWTSRTLPGEGYEEPAVSPGGVAATWPLGQGRFLAWQSGAGYRLDQVAAPNQEYTETTVVTDGGVVTYAYGASMGTDQCGLALVTKAPGGTEARQEVPFPGYAGCGDSALSSLDVNTIVYDGGDESQVLRWVVTRSDPSAAWALTTIAPAAAPGLVRVEGGLYNHYFGRPNQQGGPPLVTVHAQDRRTIVAQTYDAVAQRWAAPVPVHTSPERCKWHRDGDLSAPAYVALLSCDRRTVALTSLDGLTWQAHPGVRAALGVTRDARYAAVATRGQVHLLSKEGGRVTLPYGVSRPCELVMPAGPDTAALLTTKPGRRGWPARVRTSGATGWTGSQKLRLPTPRARCHRISLQLFEESYFASGRLYSGYAFTMRQAHGRWRVRTQSF